MKSNDFLKKEYIDYTYSFVNNFIYLVKKLFNIDKNLLKINLFPNFNKYDYKYPKNNILIKKINEYKKNLPEKLKFNNFFKNNKNNRSNFYDAENKIKDTGIIDNEGKFKSQELLNYVLNKFPNLKYVNQWTKSSSHVILYVLNLKEEFFKRSEENENWFNDHFLYMKNIIIIYINQQLFHI